MTAMMLMKNGRTVIVPVMTTTGTTTPMLMIMVAMMMTLGWRCPAVVGNDMTILTTIVVYCVSHGGYDVAYEDRDEDEYTR